jgi:hypothetical protein
MEPKMKTRSINIMSILLICLVLQACGNVPVPLTPSLTVPSVTQPAAPINTATNVPTLAPVPSATSTTIPEPTIIQHLSKPGDPVYIKEQDNIDCTLGNTTGTNLNVVIPPACDNPVLGFIERPVSADTKSYLPYLDIGQTHFGGNTNWLYARADIYDSIPTIGTGDVYYFFKLDLNYDGRNGNLILISVKNLPLDAGNWTVTGVQAWSDINGTLSTVFDQGVGAGPDLVWARRSPKAIELAFKPSILNGPTRFAWGAWAYQGALTPPDISISTIVPNVYQIENTCTWGFNVSAYGLANHCIRQ